MESSEGSGMDDGGCSPETNRPASCPSYVHGFQHGPADLPDRAIDTATGALAGTLTTNVLAAACRTQAQRADQAQSLCRRSPGTSSWTTAAGWDGDGAAAGFLALKI